MESLLETLHELPPGVPSLALMVTLLLFTELGYRFAARAYARTADREFTSYSMVEGAALGLLALLLAFSFSFSADRYEYRRLLVVREANGIGTLYLRAGLLDPAVRDAVRERLRGYIDARLAYLSAVGNAARDEADKASLRLQLETWRTAVQVQRDHPTDHGPELFVQALNEVIDLNGEQTAAHKARIPTSMVTLMAIASMVSVFGLGFAFGQSGHRNSVALMGLSLLVALVLYTILDFDRPDHGLIRVSTQAMTGLRDAVRQAEGR
jgi:hypothetical protein